MADAIHQRKQKDNKICDKVLHDERKLAISN